MKLAYADPPYLGMAARFYAEHHPDAADYDSIEAHARLIERLEVEYDGWALSLASTNLYSILPLCPPDVRVGAWVKPFAVFKVNVNPAYAWEPVIFRPLPRKLTRDVATTRDWVAEVITLQRGVHGAKPERFAHWIFDLLRAEPEDEFDDLFPGSGAVGRAWDTWRQETPELGAFDPLQVPLWEVAG